MTTEPIDWTREQCGRFKWWPARQLLRSIRDYQRFGDRRDPMAALMKRWCVVRHRFWSMAAGADIPLNAQLGGGMLLAHPNGIVIHPDSQVGINTLILHGVTLGAGGPIPGVPTVGDNVLIGCGAKILGGVRLGNNARIGANAVVLQDVPAGATAVGIPARIIPAPHTFNIAEAQPPVFETYVPAA